MNEQTWVPEFPTRYVSVWPHTLGDFEKFEGAIATVDAGVLYVWRTITHGDGPTAPDKSRPPIKVYAPGYWATFEHVGDYHWRPNLMEKTRQFVETYGSSPSVLADQVLRMKQENSLPAPDEESPAEQTSEIPVYRDPTEQLAPDLLDEENGDVNASSGMGAIVPKPKAEEPGGGGVAVPKGDSTSESLDTDVSVARYIFGGFSVRLPSWRPGSSWRRLRDAFRRLPSPIEPSPTHLLSPVARAGSRTAALSLAALPISLALGQLIR